MVVVSKAFFFSRIRNINKGRIYVRGATFWLSSLPDTRTPDRIFYTKRALCHLSGGSVSYFLWGSWHQDWGQEGVLLASWPTSVELVSVCCRLRPWATSLRRHKIFDLSTPLGENSLQSPQHVCLRTFTEILWWGQSCQSSRNYFK